jgi:hypothetical protein
VRPGPAGHTADQHERRVLGEDRAALEIRTYWVGLTHTHPVVPLQVVPPGAVHGIPLQQSLATLHDWP